MLYIWSITFLRSQFSHGDNCICTPSAMMSTCYRTIWKQMELQLLIMSSIMDHLDKYHKISTVALLVVLIKGASHFVMNVYIFRKWCFCWFFLVSCQIRSKFENFVKSEILPYWYETQKICKNLENRENATSKLMF